MKPSACFFSTAPLAQINREQYSLSDIRILRELGFEVVIANRFEDIPRDCDLYFSWWASGSVLPMIVAKLARKPNIVVAGGNEAMFYRDSVSGIPLGYLNMPWHKRAATRLTLRFSTVVTAVSNFMLGDVSKLAGREVLIVPNCVDTAQFSPDAARAKQYVTTCFRLDEDAARVKRGENLIRAAAKVVHAMPQQIFVFIGYKGDAYQRLQELVDELGIASSVIFTGGIQNSQVRDWLVQSKCYVQISDTETFGVAVAEAMSAAIPVVVSRRGGLPELAGELATYVDHNSVDSITAGLLEVLGASQEHRDDIGARLRATVIDRYRYEVRKAAIGHIVRGLVPAMDTQAKAAGT